MNGNTSGGGGGGIASGPGNGGTAGSSTLVLNFSQVNGNTSTGGPMDGAGGIANGGMATLNLSQVNGNTAPGASGGGIFNHGTMTLNLSEVANNTAPNDGMGNDGMGGGIANLNLGPPNGAPNGGIMTLNGTKVVNNTASGIGGGILEAGFTSDFSITSGQQLTLKLSLVAGNFGSDGGGIFAVPGSPVTLQLSAVVANHPNNCSPGGSIAGCVG